MKVMRFHSEPLQDSWLDAYGHLNEAYYLVPFTNTTWIMQDHFKIGVDYFEKTGCALYTVETHLRYVSEVRQPATIDVETMILGSDPKKIWFAHVMLVEEKICATAEFMLLHYSTRENRTIPMPQQTQIMLDDAEIDPRPNWVGRRISLGRQ